MTDGRLRALVTWTVEDPPAQARLGRLLSTVVDAAATVAALGTTTGARPTPTWAVPTDPGAYLDLGQVRVRGDAPWLALAWIGHLAGWPEPAPA